MDAKQILKYIKRQRKDTKAFKNKPPIILLEGVEGVGKSTIVKHLVKKFSSKNFLIKTYHNPTSHLGATKLLDFFGYNKSMFDGFDRAMCFLMAQNRINDEICNDILNKNYDLIILDRSVFFSGFVYNGHLECNENTISILREMLPFISKVDYTILLVAEPKVIQERIQKDSKNRAIKNLDEIEAMVDIIAEQQACYIEFAKNNYLGMKSVYENSLEILDTEKDDVEKRILEIVHDLLNEKENSFW